MSALGAIFVLLAAQAAGQAPSSNVSEVVVPGGPAPRITATYPAQGAAVSGGELALKVTFDQAMDAGRWAFAAADGGAFPVCLGRPRLLADRHTFVLLCQVKPNGAYAVTISPPQGFQGEAGRAAETTVLKFSTSGEIVDDLHDALDAAGLTDADEPIMTWNDDGKTPPRSTSPG
jgi:hypothetical protein